MRDNAYAKINVCLNIKSKREDGFHELEMIMLPLHFYDILEMEVSDKMELIQNFSYIPTNNKNTIIKAINIMRDNIGFKENFKIKLVKNIPIQAGLAGGSADGASAMRLVKSLLGLNITNKKMLEMAKLVGSDVPFCLYNKPALVKGIGENIEPIDANCDFYILLVKPKRGISTKVAFTNYDINKSSHPDVYKMRDALVNNDYENIISNLGNSLEEVSFELLPVIKDIKEKMIDLGLDGALMSGSGSCVFGISKDKEIIENAYRYFISKKYFSRLTNIKKSYI